MTKVNPSEVGYRDALRAIQRGRVVDIDRKLQEREQKSQSGDVYSTGVVKALRQEITRRHLVKAYRDHVEFDYSRSRCGDRTSYYYRENADRCAIKLETNAVTQMAPPRHFTVNEVPAYPATLINSVRYMVQAE
ncbi:MAG: hypothetical protein HY539_00805 [Deltaproteobacteria bacterium]|nr:hypothetical protein [Deltaproteobacteria bacterium]